MKLTELYQDNNHTTDKWGKGNHPYLAVYDKLFERMKDRVNNILEIGVYRGDSLNLWAEYFINSKIYGIDPDTWQIDIPLHSNIIILKEDAYRRETIKILKNVGKFDLIIDDGSHLKIHQKFVIENYFDLLTDDGILIIEDCVYGVKESKTHNIKNMVELFPSVLRRFVSFKDMRNEGNVNSYLLICNKG